MTVEHVETCQTERSFEADSRSRKLRQVHVSALYVLSLDAIALVSEPILTAIAEMVAGSKRSTKRSHFQIGRNQLHLKYSQRAARQPSTATYEQTLITAP